MRLTCDFPVKDSAKRLRCMSGRRRSTTSARMLRHLLACSTASNTSGSLSLLRTLPQGRCQSSGGENCPRDTPSSLSKFARTAAATHQQSGRNSCHEDTQKRVLHIAFSAREPRDEKQCEKQPRRRSRQQLLRSRIYQGTVPFSIHKGVEISF